MKFLAKKVLAFYKKFIFGGVACSLYLYAHLFVICVSGYLKARCNRGQHFGIIPHIAL